MSSFSGDTVPIPSESCKVDDKLIRDENNVAWRPRRYFLHTLPFYYASASKLRLTSMVVLSTIGGCLITPMPFDSSIALAMGVSSFLMSSSANSINQLLEYPHDSQMHRTKARLLPLCTISPSQMLMFGLGSGMLSVAILAYFTNPITVALSVFNFLLYVAVYTPMKQVSIYNTWVGSIVGAIPPLAGYTAMTGQVDISSLFLALVLYCWQFPHFNSLSWLLRENYARAGIKMMVNHDVPLLTRVTIRYAVITTLVCSIMPIVCGLTTSSFAATSLMVNLPVVYLSYKFKLGPNNSNSLALFKMSLVQLVLLILLLVAHKKPLPLLSSEEEGEIKKTAN